MSYLPQRRCTACGMVAVDGECPKRCDAAFVEVDF